MHLVSFGPSEAKPNAFKYLIMSCFCSSRCEFMPSTTLNRLALSLRFRGESVLSAFGSLHFIFQLIAMYGNGVCCTSWWNKCASSGSGFVQVFSGRIANWILPLKSVCLCRMLVVKEVDEDETTTPYKLHNTTFCATHKSRQNYLLLLRASTCQCKRQ